VPVIPALRRWHARCPSRLAEEDTMRAFAIALVLLQLSACAGMSSGSSRPPADPAVCVPDNQSLRSSGQIDSAGWGAFAAGLLLLGIFAPSRPPCLRLEGPAGAATS
jgi:hypothetical protein